MNDTNRTDVGRPAAAVTQSRWLVAGTALAGVIAAGALLWTPVWGKTLSTARMLAALKAGNSAAALAQALRAAEADRLDGRPAADAAQLAVLCLRVTGVPEQQVLGMARSLARRAASTRGSSRAAISSWRQAMP